ncbi:hypothetical protein [Rubrivirga sp.]|uniref:hypothetical protein n=1 Tax=Rubrivirga sp. TaxID=1885344 RepID=UPI003C77FB3F
MRPLLIAALIMVVAVAPRAQSDPGVEIAEALLSMLAVGNPVTAELVIGRLPDGFDAARMPDGATVLGGFVIPRGLQVVRVGVGRLEGEPADLAEAYAASIPEGWAAGPSPSPSGAVSVCGPSGEAEVLFTPRRAGGAFVSVALEPGTCDGGLVEDEIIEDVPQGDMEDVIGDGEIIDEPGGPGSSYIPLPLAQDDVAARGGFDAVFEDGTFVYRGSSARYIAAGRSLEDATLEAEAALEDAGWRRHSADDVDGVRVQTWSQRLEGATALTTLTVRALESGAEVSLVVTR